jgi:hypothetical protein
VLLIASSKDHDFLAGVVENTEWGYQVSLVIIVLLVDFIFVLLLNYG